ncbi:MAG: hypothetical protein JNN25_12530 [Candidatus Kapabacteria bacterium]|nr:hypothetical protein [Candidatus Kapabacteria bacterium]
MKLNVDVPSGQHRSEYYANLQALGETHDELNFAQAPFLADAPQSLCGSDMGAERLIAKNCLKLPIKTAILVVE